MAGPVHITGYNIIHSNEMFVFFGRLQFIVGVKRITVAHTMARNQRLPNLFFPDQQVTGPDGAIASLFARDASNRTKEKRQENNVPQLKSTRTPLASAVITLVF
jgi:hypothetical protein